MGSSANGYDKAQSPDDIFPFFVERMNSGDIDGVMELFEEDAAMVLQPGQPTTGLAAIREALQGMIDGSAQFSTEGQRPSVIVGDLALTSAHLGPDTVTAEVARRQPDGTWKWVIDNPNFLAD